MSTAIPPAPPPLPPSATAGGGPVSVAVVADTAGVADLPEGALVEALAQARAAKGVIEALTANGPVQLKASGPLPPIPEGAKLLLQVLNKDGEAMLRLLAINGRPLAGTSLPGGPGLAGLGQPGMGPLLAGGVTMGGLLAPGADPQGAGPAGLAPMPALAGAAAPAAGPLGLTATLIRPATLPGAAPGEIAGQPGPLTANLPVDLPAGTRLTVRIAGVGPPLPDPAALAGAPVPAPSGQPVQPNAAAALPQPALPSPANPLAPISLAPPTLSGTVTAHPAGGHALVQTPIGTLALPAQAELPTGTPVTLEVVGAPLPPPAAAATAAAKPPGLTAQGWPALTEALDTLSAGNQTQAMEQLLHIMPQTGPRLAASMAVFAGAMRTGEARALMPEGAARGLEKAGKKELLERIKADLEELGEQASRPVGNGDWRAITMPFLNGGAIEPIRLFVRAAGDEEGGKRSGGTGNDQRFVLDLKLTRLGRVQMDGLVRREDKLFDLIIRTDEALPPEMRRDILGIFTNASELVGTKGSVSFQAGGRWMEFPPAPPAPTRIEV